MAKNVGGFAVEVAASDARFARCGDLLWTRLLGKRGKIDLLFRTDSAALSERGAYSLHSKEGIRSLA